MRIAFFGLPLGALTLLGRGHSIPYAALIDAKALGTRRLRKRVPIRVRPDLNRSDEVAAVRAAKPDLLVSWFWTKKIPASVLEIAPAFGVHPSLLPKYRGPDPYFWSILQGDRFTGVTAHRLEIEYDTGDILAQEALEIDPTWNAWTLAKRLDRPSLRLLGAMADRFRDGPTPTGTRQDPNAVSQAPEPTPEALSIRWTESSARIERLVRAAAPFPGATTQIGDAVVSLTCVTHAHAFPKALAPGEGAVVETSAGRRTVVRTGDGALSLEKGRDEDDRPLAPIDFCELIETARTHAPS